MDRDSVRDGAPEQSADCADGVLVVGALSREIPDQAPFAGGLPLHGSPDGISAMRVLSDPTISVRIGVVIADAQLPDMTGLGLLRRAASIGPQAARVLLVDPADAMPAADALPGLGLADAWPQPHSLQMLLQRLLQERPALVRVHHLHRRLEAAADALERLESRFRSIRAAHDQLAASVRAVVGEDRNGPAHRHLERWWRDYGDWLELREGRWPVHCVALPLDELFGAALDELATRGAGPFGDAWLGSRPRIPPAARVHMDPVLARQTLVRLLLGLTEIAARSASVGWALEAAPRQRLRFELRVSALRTGIPAPELLEDPFARLPEGALAALSMDLVMAVALCRAQGGELRFQGRAEGLAVELALPAPAAPAAPATLKDAPRDSARRPVVPGGKAVL